MLLITGILVASALVFQPPPATRSGVPEHLAYPIGYKAKPNVAYMHLSTPRPMSIEEWEVYASMLRLSDEQRRALEGTYDVYRREDWALRVEHVQALFDRTAELGPLNLYSQDVAAEFVAIFHARDRVLPEILRLERALFADVAPFLAETQLESLEVVRTMRERSNDKRFDTPFPGFHFDLDMALIRLDESGVDVTPDDQDAFEQLMQTWRVAAGSLYSRHAEEARRALELGLLFRADMYAARANRQAELAADLEAKYKAVREPATLSARRIHDLHRSSVARDRPAAAAR